MLPLIPCAAALTDASVGRDLDLFTQFKKERGVSENTKRRSSGTHCSCYFGVHMILLTDGSMRVRGVRVQGHDEMAMKLLFWELEQHLKR